MTLQDSGKREEFATGAVRDTQENKGRCDLLPLDSLIHDAGGYTNRFFDYLEAFKNTGDPMHIARAILMLNKSVFLNWESAYLELAIHYEEGAKKYGDNNWQKGLPVSRYLSSAIRHYLKFHRDDQDEPHDRAVLWNLTAIIWTCKHLPAMNDYAAHIQATNAPRQCGKTFQQALQAEFNNLANIPQCDENAFLKQVILNTRTDIVFRTPDINLRQAVEKELPKIIENLQINTTSTIRGYAHPSPINGIDYHEFNISPSPK